MVYIERNSQIETYFQDGIDDVFSIISRLPTFQQLYWFFQWYKYVLLYSIYTHAIQPHTHIYIYIYYTYIYMHILATYVLIIYNMWIYIYVNINYGTLYFWMYSKDKDRCWPDMSPRSLWWMRIWSLGSASTRIRRRLRRLRTTDLGSINGVPPNHP